MGEVLLPREWGEVLLPREWGEVLMSSLSFLLQLQFVLVSSSEFHYAVLRTNYGKTFNVFMFSQEVRVRKINWINLGEVYVCVCVCACVSMCESICVCVCQYI